MPAIRSCRVTWIGLDGIAHRAEVQAATLFEAAAEAVGLWRAEGWVTEQLAPNVVFEVEVMAPPLVHKVPLKAVEQWLRSPSSPRDVMPKRRAREALGQDERGG